MLSSFFGIRNQSTVSTDEKKPAKRTCDIVDQPRPGFYGFVDWKMFKDYNKRMCVKEQYVYRMRLNALRKNIILPKELRVGFFFSYFEIFCLGQTENMHV